MIAIIDPESSTALCGVCGEVYTLVTFADSCCEPDGPTVLREYIAGALVVLAVAFLFAVLPFAT